MLCLKNLPLLTKVSDGNVVQLDSVTAVPLTWF